MPRVSVVVPNYNHERFLERRIQSIFEQTFQDFELILLDDASTDDSIHIIEKYRSDSRVKIVVNKANSGSPFPQWNRGVELACGEYVWIAEADDDAEPELLETLTRELDNCPSAAFAYCQSWIIDEHGKRLTTADGWTDHLDNVRWRRDFLNDGPEEARRYLILQNTIPNASAVVFRRSAFLQAGGARTSMRLCGDWMMWTSLALRGHVAFISTPLNLFRMHSATVRSSTSHLCFLQEWFEVLAVIEAKAGVPHDLRKKISLRLLKDWRSEYWHHPHSIAFTVVYRVGSFLWRMDRPVAISFFLFFSLRKTLGKAGLGAARKLWMVFKRFVLGTRRLA